MRNDAKEPRETQRRSGYDTGVAVLPAYNEGSHVGSVVDEIYETDLVEHVVVVDDASDDDTAANAASAGAMVLRNEVNRRAGGAIKRGYARALELGADVVYRLDADGQHNPGNLWRFHDEIADADCNYVLGNRFAESDHFGSMPLDRLIGNRITALVTSLRTRTRIADPSCGFRAIDASYLRRIPYSKFSDDFQLDIQELIAIKQLGGKLRQVAVDCIYSDEESYLSYLDGLKLLLSNLHRLDSTPADESNLDAENGND